MHAPVDKTLEVLNLGPAGFGKAVRYALGGELASAVVPGLRVPLAEVFRV